MNAVYMYLRGGVIIDNGSVFGRNSGLVARIGEVDTDDRLTQKLLAMLSVTSSIIK